MALTADVKKKAFELFAEGLPAEKVTMKLRNRGVSLATATELEREWKARNEKPAAVVPSVDTSSLLMRLAELAASYGAAAVYRESARLVTLENLLRGNPVSVDADGNIDDEAAMLPEMMANGSAETRAEA